MDTVIQSILKAIPPVHPDGVKFVLAFAAVTGLLFWIGRPAWLFETLAWLGVILTIWCAYFFRDPVRQVPQVEGLVVSPADGRVTAVSEVIPPAELELGSEPRKRVSIFLSVFDVHINRVPIEGRITRVVYREGAFINAELDKASEDNERNSLVIETPKGEKLGVVQIAGLIARRIVNKAKEGDRFAAGERYGLIRFGSRVDVYLPQGATVLVGVGQTAIGGETAIATLTSLQAPTAFKAD